jgi:hypothetical protein
VLVIASSGGHGQTKAPRDPRPSSLDLAALIACGESVVLRSNKVNLITAYLETFSLRHTEV